MRSFIRLTAAAAIVLCSCSRTESQQSPPQITFDPVFPPLSGPLMTISSPAFADLDGDGVDDLVFGTGLSRVQPSKGKFIFAPEPDPSGYVVAVSGATNQILWQTPNPRDGFTTPRFADLNGDRVVDIVMGGREAVFAAYDGRSGKVLWRVNPAQVAKTPVPYSFFTPAIVRDTNHDGVADFVVTYGGDDTRLSHTPREPGYITLISGVNGAVLASHMLPDRKESYAAVVAYDRADGEWVIFGTGGETDGGAAFRAPVASLLDGSFSKRVERLIEPNAKKGVMAPAVLLELTGDTDTDIVISTFDGRLVAIDGATGKTIWQQHHDTEETYHSPAVVRLDSNGRLGLFVSRGIGAFPRYVGTAHRLHDAKDGKILYEYKDPFYAAGAPLAVDLTGDGIDEAIFFTTQFPSAIGGRIHILHGASGKLITHDLDTNYWSTPAVGDPRHTGTLELAGLSWSQDSSAVAWQGVKWHLTRLNLNAKTPATITWGGYMGTKHDGRPQLR